MARLAGGPAQVIERARTILSTLEEDHLDAEGRPKVPARRTGQRNEAQLSLFAAEKHPLLDEIKQLDLDQMTPLAALEKLHQMREGLKE